MVTSAQANSLAAQHGAAHKQAFEKQRAALSHELEKHQKLQHIIFNPHATFGHAAEILAFHALTDRRKSVQLAEHAEGRLEVGHQYIHHHGNDGESRLAEPLDLMRVGIHNADDYRNALLQRSHVLSGTPHDPARPTRGHEVLNEQVEAMSNAQQLQGSVKSEHLPLLRQVRVLIKQDKAGEPPQPIELLRSERGVLKLVQVPPDRARGSSAATEQLRIFDSAAPTGRMPTPHELLHFGVTTQADLDVAVERAILSIAPEDLPR